MVFPLFTGKRYCYENIEKSKQQTVKTGHGAYTKAGDQG